MERFGKLRRSGTAGWKRRARAWPVGGRSCWACPYVVCGTENDSIPLGGLRRHGLVQALLDLCQEHHLAYIAGQEVGCGAQLRRALFYGYVAERDKDVDVVRGEVLDSDT